MDRKKIIISVIVVAILVAIVLVVFSFAHPSASNGGQGTPSSSGSSTGGGSVQTISQASLTADAYTTALARAKTWESDAAPFKVISTDASGDDWQFTFVSPTHPGKGLEVAINGATVATTTQVAIVGSGMPLPANMISPDEAMAKAKAIPGYGNIAVVSLEMIYNSTAKQWYWGTKMANGATITIKATP